MTFPSVVEVVETAFSSSTTAHLVDMPADTDSGDLLLIFFTSYANRTMSLSGWTELLDQTDQTFVGAAVYAIVADGTEGGTTVDVVTSSASAATAQCYHIKAWGGNIADVELTAVSAGSSSSTPNPPSHTASWGSDDNLWIAAAHSGDDDQSTSAIPTNYLIEVDTPCGAGGNLSGRISTARRELASATDNPGTFTLAGTEAWVAVTAVVKPGTSGTTGSSFPTVESVTETAFASAATSHAVSMPATVVSGDLLLILFAGADNHTTTLSGWTELADQSDRTFATGAIYAKVSDGTEGGTTVDVVSSTARSASAQCYRISGWGGNIADVELTAASSGSSNANPNPPSHAASWGFDASLWIASAATGDDDQATNTYSTFYTDGTDTPCGGGTNDSGRIASCRRLNFYGKTQDPSTFTLASSEAHVTATIVVKPDVPPGGATNPKGPLGMPLHGPFAGPI